MKLAESEDGQSLTTCHIVSLGMMDYAPAWELQKALAQQRAEGNIANVLLLVEHSHVYTIGRRGKESDLLLTKAELASLGAQVFWIDRGGEATYHGPGQLVGYPIINLRSWGGPHIYMRTLEEVLIKTLREFGIEAGLIEGLTGVWAGQEKIAALGVKISRGITTHGFALNVSTDLSYFSHIVPCGIADKDVTSMERILGRRISLEEVLPVLANHFGHEFGWETEPATLDQLNLENIQNFSTTEGKLLSLKRRT